MTYTSIIVFIVALLGLLISKIKINKERVRLLNGVKETINYNANPLVDISTGIWLSIIISSLIVWVISISIFFSLAGKQYFIVSPMGTKTAIVTEGIKLVMPLSKISVWDKYIDVRVTTEKMDKEALNELEGQMSPVGIRFVDQVTAKTYPAVRFQLPFDKDSFIKMAIKFRSVSNLVNNTLIPTIKEQLLNTGYMFSAQDYISGEAQNFRQTFEEQLLDGAYKVKKLTVRDTTYEEISQTDINRKVKSIKTSYNVVKVLSNGIPERIPTEITENNILVSQVILDNVALEEAFVKRLENQRDESAKRQLEQQKVKTAKDARERIIAEGERDKAQEKVKQELAQVQVLINKETMLKEEETNKKLAQIQLETERIKANQVKVKADADAYEIRKKVSAGITPEKKLQMELDASVQRLEAISKLTLPTTMFIGSSGSGDSDLLTKLIGADIATKINANNRITTK